MKLKTKNGYEFEIDDEDESLAREKGWLGHTGKDKKATGEWSAKTRQYIMRNLCKDGKWTQEYLHRRILGLAPDTICDHINGNGLDNRKKNLRICTTSENGANRDKQINNKSGYKGVWLDKRRNKWAATIKVQDKKYWIGYFNSKESAAEAYNQAALRYFGNFAKLNDIHPVRD